MTDRSNGAIVPGMEMLAITAAITLFGAGWLHNRREARKLSQRFDIQAQLIADLANLYTDQSITDDSPQQLHLVPIINTSDLAKLEAFILRLHMCHHRRSSYERGTGSGR